MKNIETKSSNVDKLTSSNIENSINRNATNSSWINIICDFLGSAVGANMITSVIILVNNYNIDELPTPYKISIYVGGITSLSIKA